MKLEINYVITIKASGIMDCGRAGMLDPKIIQDMFSEGDVKRELVKVARDVLDLDDQDFKVRDAEDFYKIAEVKV